MLPLRLVLDTNMVVSALLKPGGMQRAVLTMSLTPPARLFASEAMLQEYADVLARPELKTRRGLRLQAMQLIRNRVRAVAPPYRINACADADDNMLLECADAARADYLITGNARHFPAFWKSTKIVTTREFIEMAAPHLRG